MRSTVSMSCPNTTLIHQFLEDLVRALLEERGQPDLPPLFCDLCDNQVTLGGTDYPLPSMLCLCEIR